jgi:hypothetical protein
MAVEPKPTAKTVFVGCKLPHGIELRLYNVTKDQPSQPVGDPVVLAGSNADNAVAGYGITENVDAAFFAAWMDQNQQFPAVRAGLIFAETDAAKTRDAAIERARVESGFEGLNPEQPPGGVQPDNYEGRPATKAT